MTAIVKTRFRGRAQEPECFGGDYDGTDPDIVDPDPKRLDFNTFPPVLCPPGSAEKMEAMALRYELGLPLFHPLDRTDHGPEAQRDRGAEAQRDDAERFPGDDAGGFDFDDVDDPLDL